MERTFKATTLSIRKKGFLKSLILSLSALASIWFLIYAKSNIRAVPSMLLMTIPYILLVIYSFSLTQEFTNKTDKMIFTGIFSRNEIMFSKLMSFICSSVICFGFYEAISAICGTFDVKMLFNNLCVFLIYAFTIGSFILLVSTITSNFMVTGIVGYVLYFDLILVLLNQALSSSRNETLKQIILNLPFYIANTGFYSSGYTLRQYIIMIISGILFLTAGCYIVNKKDM